jgi:hypothetical protein
MAGNLRKCLGMVVVVTIVAIIVTIYFRDGIDSKILLMVPSNFLMAYCLEISKQNLITRVSWIRLVAILNRSKDLN